MANWNDSNNLSFSKLFLFISFSILIPGSAALYLGTRTYEFWEYTARCRFMTSGVVEDRFLETNPETGEVGLRVKVLFHIGGERFHCEEWSPGRVYLCDARISDPLFYENGSKQEVFYDPNSPKRAMLHHFPPEDILVTTLICLVLAIPGLFLPLISGSRIGRNRIYFGEVQAFFLFFWSWGLPTAILWYMPQMLELIRQWLPGR